jgi:hypothetical protein
MNQLKSQRLEWGIDSRYHIPKEDGEAACENHERKQPGKVNTHSRHNLLDFTDDDQGEHIERLAVAQKLPLAGGEL